VTRHRVTITGNDGTGNTAHLAIDGTDISPCVTALRLDIGSVHEHRLTLKLAAFPMNADLEGVTVDVDDDTHGLLRKLGWTPPADR
jgi:hypothetical protein